MTFLKVSTYHIILLFIDCFSFAFSFSVEEMKWINYEVDISSTPLMKDEEQTLPHVHMTSKYGQEYCCILPQLDDDELTEKETVTEKSLDVQELLKPMHSGSCLLKSKDWWTYEFCFGHYIKQFHIEDSQIVGQVLTLGLYESDYDWKNESDVEKFKNVKQKYHSQYYTNGTKCDLTGQPRNAEVRFYCEEDAGDYIYRVDEPSSCSYVITVHTSRLCSHPQLKPLPSNKAHIIPCHPVLNEEQYSKYLLKQKEEKAKAEEKRNQWLNNQQERLQILKNGNVLHIGGVKLAKLKEFSKKFHKIKNQADSSGSTDKEDVQKGKEDSKLLPEANDEVVQLFLLQEYDKEIERLKATLPPEKFASVKNEIQKHFSTLLSEAEEELDSVMSDESKEAALSTLNMLLKKLDKAEKDVAKATDELKKARWQLPETDKSTTDGPKTTKEDLEKGSDDEKENAEPLKVVGDDNTQSAVLDDNKVHVRIRRLDRKSSDSNKLYEMDVLQLKKLEQAVKQKLEKAGLDTGGRRIEVKIITAGYYDNEDGKDFHTFSDEETNQFQNMIMALLTGQQEAVQEMTRYKKLEENYNYIWENKDNNKENEV